MFSSTKYHYVTFSTVSTYVDSCTCTVVAEAPLRAERAPDGGWGWMVVLGATITHFLLVGTARCLGVIYVALRERYQSSSADTAWVAAIFNTSRTLTGM